MSNPLFDLDLVYCKGAPVLRPESTDYLRGNYDGHLVKSGVEEEKLPKVPGALQYPTFLPATAESVRWAGGDDEFEVDDSYLDGFVALYTRNLSRDACLGLVFNLGMGFFWAREWLYGFKHNAPKINDYNKAHFSEFVFHPAVVSTAEREYAELFYRGLILVEDIPVEVNRGKVYDIAVMYGCARVDLIMLITNAIYTDGALAFGAEFRCLPCDNSVKCTVPLPQTYPFPCVDKVKYVPSLREMCCAVLPFGAGTVESAVHHKSYFGCDEPCINEGGLQGLEPGLVAYFDTLLGHPVLGPDIMLSMDTNGTIFKRGSTAAILSGRGRATGDVDESFRVVTYPKCEKDHKTCDHNCRFIRTRNWLIACGVTVMHVEAQIARVYLPPQFVIHRQWVSFFLRIAAEKAYGAGCVGIKFVVRDRDLSEYAYVGANKAVSLEVSGLTRVMQAVKSNGSKLVKGGYVVDRSLDLTRSLDQYRVTPLMRHPPSVARPDAHGLDEEIVDGLGPAQTPSYVPAYNLDEKRREAFPWLRPFELSDNLGNYTGSVAINGKHAERAMRIASRHFFTNDDYRDD